MTEQIIAPSEQHTFYMLLFNLILRHNDRLRLDVAETIRLILLHPDDLSPAVQDMLRLLRDGLLVPPQPEIVSTFLQPTVSLVVENEKENKP
jgi:hypothetical protein